MFLYHLIFRHFGYQLILRMLIKLSKGGNEEYVELLGGSKRYFKDLKGDTRVLDPDYDRIEELNEDFEKFRKHLEKKQYRLEKDLFLKVLSIVRGRLEIMNCKMEHHIGEGVYFALNPYHDHSCDPNCSIIFNGKTAIVRSFTDIKDVNDIRISFIDIRIPRFISVSNSTAKRQAWLMKHFNLFCQCSKCLDVERDQIRYSLKCTSCQNGCVPSATGICIDCGCQIDPALIQEHKILRDVLVKEIEMDHETNKSWKRELGFTKQKQGAILEKAQKIFHYYDDAFLSFLSLCHFYELLDFDENGELCSTVDERRSYYKLCKLWQKKFLHPESPEMLRLYESAAIANYMNGFYEEALANAYRYENTLKMYLGFLPWYATELRDGLLEQNEFKIMKTMLKYYKTSKMPFGNDEESNSRDTKCKHWRQAMRQASDT